MPVYWNRCEGDIWGELYAINLNDPHFDNLEGVYMIWLGGPKPAAICAGSGLIREKLEDRRAAPELQALREKSILVSWAKVGAFERGGVERWLLQNLKPKIANVMPDAAPIEVNLPGRPGQAEPDAGEPPNQIFDVARASTGTPPRVSPRVSPFIPPPPPPAQKLPLQDEVVELLRKGQEKSVYERILKEAVKLRASDVHVEPLDEALRVRVRVDGILEEVLQIPSSMNLRLVPHIRAACGLEAERGAGKAEDGRMTFTHDGGEVDVRLSTFPTANGDTAVLHLIPRSSKVQAIGELGLAVKTADALRSAIGRPQGMFIATGPAGSGKSTTLYACLQLVNTPSSNIVTLEDPIEKKIPGINQGAIQPKAGFGFAEGMRAIVRQDANVIMVGELRDRETAELAASASLTGRMIFTTMNAGSALGAVARLVDMGLEPFLIASALTAVSAQRLARKTCPACAKPYEPTSSDLAEIDHQVQRAGIKPPAGLLLNLKQGKGCESCRGSGYAGRVLLFEHVAVTPGLRALILKKAPLEELRAAALKDGAEPLISDGLRKAGEGVVSISELFRVVDAAD